MFGMNQWLLAFLIFWLGMGALIEVDKIIDAYKARTKAMEDLNK
jgi:hypothetical protein